jgi:putative oxidoreductase
VRFLERFSPTFYSFLRIVAGFMFSCHGAQKLFGAFGGGMPHPLPPMVQAAGIIEFVGGILICVGLFTRVAAFIASGEMAFAYFTVHAKQAPWPIENKGELAALYCFVFLYFAAMGSGRLSLSSIIPWGRVKPIERAPAAS